MSLARIRNDSCSCTVCAECLGSGAVFVSFGGKYLGAHCYDDLGELECCTDCDGTGIADMCDFCLNRFELDGEES